MTHSSHWNVRISLVALLLACFLPCADAAELGVTVQKKTVSASGLVPGSRALFYALGLEPTGYESVVRRWITVVADDDRDGVATLHTELDVPWKSIWIVVDLTNNRYVVVTPSGYPLRRQTFRANSFRKQSGAVDAFLQNRSFLDALYVAPNGGTWVATAVDGQETDSDRTSDGVVALAISQMQHVDASSEKASAFTPGGLFFAIDVTAMDILSLRLDAQTLGGGQ